jgi:hypothetical protein
MCKRRSESTYVDVWRDAINETYPSERILTMAPECLRDGATHSFTGDELDVVRQVIGQR